MNREEIARCLIFGAGDYTGTPDVAGACEDSLIIAADGGYKYLGLLGIEPDVYIGDYDSAECPTGVEALRLPVEKDDTDMLAAVKLALGRGCVELHLFGGTGGRLDHTLANIQTLRFISERGCRGYLYGNGCAMTALSGETVSLPPRAAGDVSLFALDGEISGVTIEGLKYSMTDGRIGADYPIGVSNSFIGEAARITVGQGTALLYYCCDRVIGLDRKTV